MLTAYEPKHLDIFWNSLNPRGQTVKYREAAFPNLDINCLNLQIGRIVVVLSAERLILWSS